jgi:cytochrome bd-type quinol oxidase subunit 2
MIYVTIKGRISISPDADDFLVFGFGSLFAALLDFAAVVASAAAVNMTLALVGLKARHCLV